MRVTRTVPLLSSAAIAACALVPSSAGAAAYEHPKARGDIARTPLVKVVGADEVALTRSAARRYTRGDFRLACTDVPDDLVGTTSSGSIETELRKGLRLSFERKWDYCIASLQRTSRRGGTTIISLGSIAITPTGDDYLYERATAGLLSAVSTLALRGIEDRPQTVPEIIRTLRSTHAAGRPVTGVAIPAPRTEVQNDQIGIWTDGTRVSVTATTPLGRHLYLDYDRTTRDLATNVARSLNDSFGATF